LENNIEAKPNVRQAAPFFVVSDIEKSVRWYVDGLGFEMTKKWIDAGKLRWCWLQLGEAALMLQESEEKSRDSRGVEGKPGEGVTIYFLCEDALAIYREVASRGVAASKPFVGNGMWVTFLTDPDGYEIAFESLTETPEGTSFSEGAT
jgi:catechol 2,3-dioxygenase-like lactoylglutathione lyase family enzyme